MSAASPNARPTHGRLGPQSKANLLTYMKLRASNDLIVHEKISEWVAMQKVPTQIAPSQAATCRVASALLLQRLVRAFERRLNSSVDDEKKTKGSTASSNSSKPATSTNSTFGASATNGSYTKNIGQPSRSPSKPKPKPPTDLAVLMQRKVKVTRLVQQAVQFVGSDVLKVLQVLSHSPTVADVANACLKILKDVNRIKEFYGIFSKASGKNPSTIDQASSIFFGVFALQALQSLRAQAISSYELAHDFDLIYRTCYQDQTFQVCVNALNPGTTPSVGIAPAVFAPDTEARNICWKIARLLALKQDNTNKSDPESKDHRRNHILSSAASIVLAGNMGKSKENDEVTEARGGSSSAKRPKGTIPDDVDFIALVAVPVSDLLNFLVKNTTNNQGITPITNADIRSHLVKTVALINQLPIMQTATGNVASSSSNSILSKALLPTKLLFLLNNYRSITHTLVMDTQKELKINTIPNQGGAGGVNVRTGIVNVLLLFPMVIGEPWGIHRDAPMITSKMLCPGENSKPADPLKDSVAVVLKMKPNPKEVKRKAITGISESTWIHNKKAKLIPVSEYPNQAPKKMSVEPIDLVGDDSPTTPAARAPIDVRMGEIEAPVVNDSTELNEWTLSILSLSVVKPSDALLTYLGENDRMQGNGSSCLQDVIVHVLNRGVLRIQSTLRSLSNLSSEEIITTVTVGRRDGQVYVNGQVDQNIQMCASVVGFYYYSLEAIIYDQMERMEFLGPFGSLLQSESFHRALLACCYSCVLKGVGTSQKFQVNRSNNMTVQVLMDTMESDSFTFLKVIEALCRALVATVDSTQRDLGSPIVAGLPVILQKHVQKIEIQLIDSVVWKRSSTPEKSGESSLGLTIKTMKSLPGAWPPDILEPMIPEEIANMEGNLSKSTEVRYKPSFGSSSEANFLSFVLRKLLKSAFFRIQAIFAALNLSNQTIVHTQTLVAFRYLLRHHISIFNERHVDQLLLCSIYGVCRVMKVRPEITFGKIIDAYFAVRGEEQGDRACRVIVRHVKLVSPENGNQPTSQVVGNLIVFYNQTYVPKMQKYFLGSKSLKKCTAEYQKQRKKEKISKQNQIIQNKKPVDNAPKKSSTAAAAAILPSPSREKFPVGGKSANQVLPRKDSTQVSSVKKNGSGLIGNSNTIDSANSEKKATSGKSNGPAIKGKHTSTISKEVSLSEKAGTSSLVQKTGLLNPQGKASANNISTISHHKPVSLKPVEKLSGINGVDSKLGEKSTSSISSGDNRISSSGTAGASSGVKEVNAGVKEGKALGGKSTTNVVNEKSAFTQPLKKVMGANKATKCSGKAALSNSSQGLIKPSTSSGEKPLSNNPKPSTSSGEKRLPNNPKPSTSSGEKPLPNNPKPSTSSGEKPLSNSPKPSTSLGEKSLPNISKGVPPAEKAGSEEASPMDLDEGEDVVSEKKSSDATKAQAKAVRAVTESEDKKETKTVLNNSIVRTEETTDGSQKRKLATTGETST